MNAQYDALVRKSQALAHWPLGRYAGAELISGSHFTTVPPVRTPFPDSSETFGTDTFIRTVVLTATDNLTLEIWAWFDTVAGNGIWGNNNTNINGYTCGLTANGAITVVCQGVAVLTNGVRSVVPKTWNHIVVMRNAGTWQYYLNGNLDQANAGTAAPGTPSGTTSVGGSLARFHDFAEYTRVLSASEIRDHYLAGSNASYIPVFYGGETLAAPPNIETATVYLDIQPSSVDIGAVSDAATVYFDLQPSAVEAAGGIDAATIYMDIQILGGECYSRFHFTGEGEADTRWAVTDAETRWLSISDPRWAMQISIQPGCH